jgi:hypothetical protein
MSAATYRPLVRLNCPRCASLPQPDDSHCRQCGIWLAGPQLAELRWIDAELTQVDERWTVLIRRRMELVAELARQSPPSPAAVGAMAGVAVAELTPVARTTRPADVRPADVRPAEVLPGEWLAAGSRPGESRPGELLAAESRAVGGRGELSARAVARLLLSAGAALVVIAAFAFTVANWSSIGPLGRSLILLGVTALVIAAPVTLAKRGLAATAESIAAVGLALTLGDVYLVGRLLDQDVTGSLLGAAAAAAALAGGWAGYGIGLRLRAPRLGAIALGQFVPALAAAGLARSLGGTGHELAGRLALTLVLTAAADLWIADLASRREHEPEAIASALAAILTWLAGVLVAAGQALSGLEHQELPWACIAFLAASLIVITRWSANPVARLIPASPVLALSGLLLSAGLALPFATAWPAAVVPAFAVAAATVATVALTTGYLHRTRARAAAAAADAAGPRLDLVAAGALATLAMSGAFAFAGAVVQASGVASGQPAPWAIAVVLVLLGLASWLAPALRRVLVAATIVAAAALAIATPLAAGWSVRQATFPMAAVGVIAIGVATLLRRRRPAQALVLELGAGFALMAAVIMANGQTDTFTAVLALAALVASSTAWLRGGQRRIIALGSAGCAALAALGSQAGPLSRAFADPYRHVAAPWQGHQVTSVSGLPFAAGTLAVVLAALVTAVGAGRGSSRGSLDALAIALPVIAGPAILAGGLRYPLALGCLLLLAIALTGWSAATASLAPAAGALVATLLALSWALASRPATLIALGCLTVSYPLCACRSPHLRYRAVLTGLTVWAVAGLAAAAILAAGQPGWLACLGVLTIAAGALLIALLPKETADQGRLALELAAWTAVAAAIIASLDTPVHAGLALGVGALLALAAGWLAGRRLALWIGLVLLEASWCAWLVAWNAGLTELYTVPAAAIVLGFGWQAARRNTELNSWPAYGPGLALLLAPSLIVAWQSYGWLRPALLGVAAGAVILIGARTKLQAPLLIGTLTAVLTAGHQLAPEIRRVTQVLPGWLPIAIIGAVLLWAGATYEARLRNVAGLRRTLASFR